MALGLEPDMLAQNLAEVLGAGLGMSMCSRSG
jgi:hypothetical protein